MVHRLWFLASETLIQPTTADGVNPMQSGWLFDQKNHGSVQDQNSRFQLQPREWTQVFLHNGLFWGKNVQETMDFFATVLWISCVLDWKRPKICRVRATQVWGFLGWFGELLLESTRRRLHRPVLSVQESLDVRLTSNDLCHGTKMRFLVTARLWFPLWFGTTAKHKRKIPTKERVWLVPCCYSFARNDFHICSFGGEQSNTKKKTTETISAQKVATIFSNDVVYQKHFHTQNQSTESLGRMILAVVLSEGSTPRVCMVCNVM